MQIKFFLHLLIAGIFLLPCYGRAQDCSYRPADCPAADYPALGQAEDSADKLNNPLVPEEVAMEHRLRRLTAVIMDRIARSNNWELAELTEGGSSGQRTDDGAVLRYELRAPHWFGISYQVIVDKDSLAAWGAWLQDLTNRRMNNMNEYTSRVTANQGRIQTYMDSANYWALKGDSKRSNAFVNKAAALQKDAGAEKAEKDAEAEKKTRSLAFRDATVLLVEFDFNGENAMVEGGRAAANNAGEGALRLLRWYSIPDPDVLNTATTYSRSRHAALALLGAWNLQPNTNGFYFPLFASDKKNKDKTSVKAIRCDQVQAISIRLSGNPAAMRKFLADLPAGELEGMITPKRKTAGQP